MELDRQGREEDRHEAEERADLHDAVMAEAVGEDAEGRREHELGGEEERREHADGERADGLATMLRQIGQEEDQQRSGEPGGEPERERGDRDRPDAAIHGGRRVPARRPRYARPVSASPGTAVPAAVIALAEERAAARAARDWRTADALRERIETAGWRVIDDGLAFTLTAARPADVTDAGHTFYGAPGVGAVARGRARLRGPPAFVVLVDAGRDGRLDEVFPADLGLDDAQLLLVASRAAVGDGLVSRMAEADAELVGTATPFSPGDALTAGLRRASGSRIVVLDAGGTASRDDDGAAAAPRLTTRPSPSPARSGTGRPTCGDSGRAGPGDVTALGSGCYAFRRADALARGPVDGRLQLPDSVAIWWSLALRDEGPDRLPRRAIALDLPPHAASTSRIPSVPTDRARLARRDGYRIAARFAARRLAGASRG